MVDLNLCWFCRKQSDLKVIAGHSDSGTPLICENCVDDCRDIFGWLRYTRTLPMKLHVAPDVSKPPGHGTGEG